MVLLEEILFVRKKKMHGSLLLIPALAREIGLYHVFFFLNKAFGFTETFKISALPDLPYPVVEIKF